MQWIPGLLSPSLLEVLGTRLDTFIFIKYALLHVYDMVKIGLVAKVKDTLAKFNI